MKYQQAKYQQMKFEPTEVFRDWRPNKEVKVNGASFLAGILFTILSFFTFSIIFLRLSPATFLNTFFWFLKKTYDIGLW